MTEQVWLLWMDCLKKRLFSLKSKLHLKKKTQDPWNNVVCIPKYSRVRCKAVCGLAVMQYCNNQQSTAANLQQRGDRRADNIHLSDTT